VPPSVACERHADGLATVWFDVQGKSVNAVSTAVLAELDAVVRELEADPAAGVIFASAKPGTFIVGGDLFEIRDAAEPALDAFLALGQGIFERIAALGAATVAAISGDALGGGYELALACRHRVAAAEPRSRLGLPETVIGLIPGWCGTLRLPRLVGLERGLDLLVTGRTVEPSEALALGMVDEVVPAGELLAAARRRAFDPAPRPVRVDPAAADPRACSLACDRSRAATRARWGEHLPAALRIVDVVEASYREGFAPAAAVERRTLIELRRGTAGRNLLRLFFLRSAAKKEAARRAGAPPRELTRVAVVSGTPRGQEIARALAEAGLEVRLVAVDENFGQAEADRSSVAGAAEGRASEADWGAVVGADLVIEAVGDSLPAKRAAFRRLDGLPGSDAVLASTTGCLSIAALAAATRHPERVIGLHFPWPAATTQLVEVVAADGSAPAAVATGVALVARAGRTPVVVGDAPGFVVTRLLFRHLREAALLLDEGADAAAIDAAARRWGMAAGPLVTLDAIGLDTALGIFETLAGRLGERFRPPPALVHRVAGGRLGRRTGRGFHAYESDSFRPAAAPEDPGWLAARLVEPLVEEARELLAAGVVDGIDVLDLATVLGLGFPGFRGGLATFAGLGGGPPV